MNFFLRSLPRLIHNANTGMKRHFSMTLSSVLSISIALLLSMVMIVIALNVDSVSTSVENQMQLQVTLSPILSDEQIENIYTEIMKVPGVASAEYSSKDQELQKLIDENGEMFAQYEKANPLYNVYIVDIDTVDAMQEVSDGISAIQGVSEVDYGGSSILSLISVFETMRTIGYVMAIGLMILGVFLIRNTIEMTIGLREDEIFIMRTVGAYNFYILLPFILEGIFMGFFASLLPALIIGFGYPAFYSTINSGLMTDVFTLLAPSCFMPGLLTYDFATGLLLGALGAWSAVHRKIRRVR